MERFQRGYPSSNRVDAQTIEIITDGAAQAPNIELQVNLSGSLAALKPYITATVKEINTPRTTKKGPLN